MIDKNWPTDYEIERSYKNNFSRNWTCFDLSKCEHKISSIIECNNWEIEICDSCGICLSKNCLHVGLWDNKGSLLRCEFCGMDLT